MSRGGLIAFLAGSALQVGMVLVGHRAPAVAGLFGVLGVSISALAGLLYAVLARPISRGTAAGGGALVGGGCAFLGIALSLYLGDVTAAVLGFGTASSVATGAIGGFVGRVLAR
jgi:hypothetical protein